MKSTDVHIRAISQEMPQPSITKIPWKIAYLKFHSNFTGANELSHWPHLVSLNATLLFNNYFERITPIQHYIHLDDNYPTLKNAPSSGIFLSYSGMRVTKAPFVNFSVSKKLDLARVPVNSHSCFTGVVCVDHESARGMSPQRLSINVIFNNYIHNAENLGK